MSLPPESLPAQPGSESTAHPDAAQDETTQAVYGVISTMHSQPDPEAEAQALRTMSVKRNLDIPIRLHELPAAQRQQILERNAEHRRLAAHIFPPQPDNLGLQDIDDYFAESGLSTAPASIMTPDEFIACAKQMIGHGYNHPSLRDMITELEGGTTLDELYATGRYIDDLGKVIILQRPGKITGDRRIILLAKAAHEKAHSTGADDEDTKVYLEENPIMHNGFRQSRGGFAVYDEVNGQAGFFVEEGYCELKAIDYVRKRLGLPNGIWTDGSKYKKIADIALPSAYVMYDPDTGASETGVGAIPAYAFELIGAVNPELLPALDEARTSVQGLRRVARIIEGVEPRLYGRLLRTDPSPQAFKQALATIQKKLEVS